MRTSCMMFASQMMCASRVKSGAHHITLRQSRKTSLRRKPQHRLRRRRKHHGSRAASLHQAAAPPSSLTSKASVFIRAKPDFIRFVFKGFLCCVCHKFRGFFRRYSILLVSGGRSQQEKHPPKDGKPLGGTLLNMHFQYISLILSMYAVNFSTTAGGPMSFIRRPKPRSQPKKGSLTSTEAVTKKWSSSAFS